MTKWFLKHSVEKNVKIWKINSISSVVATRHVYYKLLRATTVPPGTAEARISYGNSVCLSVCLSVTTRYGFNAR